MHLKLAWCGETYILSATKHIVIKNTFLRKTHDATTTILQTIELVR